MLVLGICVGMQLLAASSEVRKVQGLNWTPGSVRIFKHLGRSSRPILPQMGWNDIKSDLKSRQISLPWLE